MRQALAIIGRHLLVPHDMVDGLALSYVKVSSFSLICLIGVITPYRIELESLKV